MPPRPWKEAILVKLHLHGKFIPNGSRSYLRMPNTGRLVKTDNLSLIHPFQCLTGLPFFKSNTIDTVAHHGVRSATGKYPFTLFNSHW